MNTITWTDPVPFNTNRGVVIGLGNNVSIIVSTETPVPPAIYLSSFTVISKHTHGDTYYGAASDVDNIYLDQSDGSTGTPLLAVDALPSTIASNEFAAPAVGPSGQGWVAK